MLSYLRDLLDAARLRARYRRLIQEQLLDLAESAPQAPAEDPGRWTLVGAGHTLSDTDRTDLRAKARHLVANNPHAINLLRLLEIYVVGPGLKFNHAPRTQGAAPSTLGANPLTTTLAPTIESHRTPTPSNSAAHPTVLSNLKSEIVPVAPWSPCPSAPCPLPPSVTPSLSRSVPPSTPNPDP